MGFTAKQLQEKSDARLAKQLKKVHKEGKERRADRKLAKQLQRASQNTDATGDPYEAVEEAKPRTKMGKSGKDIAARQARAARRR